MEELTAVEEKIFDAAKNEFTEKGFDGARMQSIADKAGISKASLHYYFRSKQKLFNKVVHFSFGIVFSSIRTQIASDQPFWDKVKAVINLYIDTMAQHRKIAFFIFSELMKHPAILEEFIGKGERLKPFFATYQAEVAKGTVRDIPPEHLLMNIISMSIYPILGEPLVKRVFQQDNAMYEAFLQQRKAQIFSFVKHALEQPREGQ
jgi:AcrR family transcriptional regulator